VRTRRARPEDLEAVGDVTVAAYAEFEGDDTDEYVHHLRDAATRDREAELWVATPDEREHEILGTVTICPPGSPWRELAGPDEGEFRMLAVAPHARGLGIGEALVRLCLERFRAEGAAGVVISSLPAMAAAHRIYGRLGFERAPELDWAPVENVRLIAFRKRLED